MTLMTGARARPHARRRPRRQPVCVCSRHRERGNAVYANRLVVPIEIAEVDPLALRLAEIRKDLQERLTDWQGLLGRETAAARQIFRDVLVGRPIFTPRIDGSARYDEFAGQATLSGLLAGAVSPDMLVTPAGFEPIGVLQVRGNMRVA